MGFRQADRKERITSPGNYYVEVCLKMGILSVFCYAICDRFKITLCRAISFLYVCEVLLMALICTFGIFLSPFET